MVPIIGIEDVRTYIAEQCLDFIRHSKGNLIYNTFTGSGKTTTILKTIYESEDGFTWMYFAPYHKVIEENIELSKVIDFHNFVHLESREKLCLSKEYRQLAKEKINITPFCENFCTLKDTRCPYYENLRIIREMPTCLAAVHAHIPTLMQTLFYEKWKGRCLFNYYDIIVIDEFPSNTIYNQIGINKKNIDYARDILELTDINTKESHLLMLIMDELSLATGSISINYSKIFSMISTYKGLNFDSFREQYDAKILELITKKRIRSPPEDIIHFLIEIYKRRPDPNELVWMICKTESSQWLKGSIYLTISNLPYFQKLPIKVIALDGTADIDAWKSILGNNCESITYDIRYKNTYQLLGARNPTSTLVRKNDFTPSGIKMLEMLKTICNYKKGNVLICASKRIQTILSKYLKKNKVKNYTFATFYNLRSRNSYFEDCDTCVIFHEPNIPPFQVEIIKNVLGWEEDLIRKINREDEIKQGIGRIRQNIPTTPIGRKREKREIFIFSSTGYKRLVPEARYMLYDDMLGFARGGKKRLFLDKLKKTIKDNSPVSKTRIKESLGLSRQTVDHIINILEEDGVIEVKWGNIKWIGEIEDEEEFLIKMGRRK